MNPGDAGGSQGQLEPAKRESSSERVINSHVGNQEEVLHDDQATPPHITENWTERANFDESIRKLISNTPGEILYRDLLRPIDGEGEEKLRETGLRVRAFEPIFEAWEELHLSTDSEGNTFIRDDVVQYLRGTNKLVAATDEDALDDSSLVPGHSLSSTIRAYEQYRSFLAKFTQILFPWFYPFHPDLLTLKSSFAKGGRGIVLTAGDNQAPYILTTIPSFRKLGCNLPIEIMYLGDSDLSEDYRADLEAMPGVITRDIAQMVDDQGWKLAGWAAKPFAILLSSFREVIFVDADSAFFTDPQVLFADAGYRQTGALFFRDRLILPESKKHWLQQILPRPISRSVRRSRLWTGDSGHQQESGVVVVDKWRHFIALLLVTRMNGPDRDGDKDKGKVGVYDMMYGDKETFWIGWELVGDLAYSFHQGDAGNMGVLKSSDDDHADEQNDKKVTIAGELQNYTMCSPQLLHLDLDGNPLWFNGWLLESKFQDKNSNKYVKFRTYLLEPHDIRDPGAWQLGQNNMACLTTDANLTRDLEPRHIEFLDWLIEKAKEVGGHR